MNKKPYLFSRFKDLSAFGDYLNNRGVIWKTS